jgi:hypothetical protein
MLRAIDLLHHQLPEPAEDGLRFGDQCRCRRAWERSSFGQAQPSWRMCPEDLVLRDKIFDLQQQFLIE